MRVFVRRLEVIPAGEPTDYVVGFEYTLDNGRTFYLEDSIPLADVAGKTDQDIATLAYAHLEELATRRESELSGQSALVHQEFIPPGSALGGNQGKMQGRRTRAADPDPAEDGASIKSGPSRRVARAKAQDPDVDVKKLTES